MTKLEKTLSVFLGIALLGLVLVGYPRQTKLGGLIHNIQEQFNAGIGVNGTEVINSSGSWVGALAGTTGSLSSTLSVTGATTLSGAVDLNRASSTLTIGGGSAQFGCIEIGDSRGSTYTNTFITVASSTITATTTKPAICN